jgi:hypothetical protein
MSGLSDNSINFDWNNGSFGLPFSRRLAGALPVLAVGGTEIITAKIFLEGHLCLGEPQYEFSISSNTGL